MRLLLTLLLLGAVVFGGTPRNPALAAPSTAESDPCAYWIDRDPDASGIHYITICQTELDAHAKLWAATGIPFEKGRQQILMGLEYYAIAYYCANYFDENGHVDARCLHGKVPDLATTSINAARQSFEHAKSNSNNDPQIVKMADEDLVLAQQLASEYDLRFDLKV
jgi:hypothetical protein